MKKIYSDLLKNIPDYKEFLTVDELDANSKKLAEKYPDIANVFNFGKTKEGRDLICLKIGDYDKNALMFGCPHPNEPIGTMMLEYFTENLCANKELRDELGFTWYIVKAWDADGLKLNEKWLKGPYTIYNYSRNFFRPAGHKQVDWTFPIDYKNYHFHDTIPEAEAMMGLIDMVKPKFIYSLHNAGFGGAYWYITHDMPELYDGFRKGAEDMEVPINYGEPETPSCVAFSPAIYKNLGLATDYDYMEKYGVEHPEEKLHCGDCSSVYAMERYDSLTFLTELPYFFDKRIDDVSPGTMLRKEAVLKKLDQAEKRRAYIHKMLAETEPYINPNDGFRLAITAFSTGGKDEAYLRLIEEDPEYNRTATVCEEFDNLLLSQFYGMLSYGMLVRMVETELENMDRTGENNPEKRSALEAAFYTTSKAHKDITDYLETQLDYSVVPIKKLIYIQLNAGLLVAEAMKNK